MQLLNEKSMEVETMIVEFIELRLSSRRTLANAEVAAVSASQLRTRQATTAAAARAPSAGDGSVRSQRVRPSAATARRESRSTAPIGSRSGLVSTSRFSS